MSALAQIRNLVPVVLIQQEEFESAVDTEVDAEIAVLLEAVAAINPALEYLGGPMPMHGRGLEVIPGYWIGHNGQFYGWDDGNPRRFVPVTPADVLDTKGSLNTALESLLTALEKVAGGNLAKRTQQALDRAADLRAIARLMRIHTPSPNPVLRSR